MQVLKLMRIIQSIARERERERERNYWRGNCQVISGVPLIYCKIAKCILD